VLTTTEGIVLKTHPHTEADLIVTYLTLDRGIITAFAKSPRKTKSRFGSSLEPLTHARISLYGKEQSMPRITQSDILRPYQTIRERFHDFAHISRLAEILISLTPEGVPNRKLFSFILNMLNFMESSGPRVKSALYIVSQIRLLVLLGYAPRLKGCGKCSARSGYFYPDSGTILCKKCSMTEKHSIRITDRAIHFYSHCIDWPIKATVRLRPARETISELSMLLEAHLTHLLNKRLHTSDFLTGV
jgi:DNA repair protein RecO (recombination protein O)